MTHILVKVNVGIGSWRASTVVRLCAAPHVGDQIVVHEDIVECERVVILPDHVEVFALRGFTSESDTAEVQREWDKKERAK